MFIEKNYFWNYFFIIFENQITFWKLKEIRISLIEIKISQIYISRYYNGRNNMGLICKWNFKNLTRNHQSYYKVLMNCVFAILKKKSNWKHGYKNGILIFKFALKILNKEVIQMLKWNNILNWIWKLEY